MWASGNASIAICDRCNRKRPYRCLRADGNSPGLRVCSDSDCWDPKNPWRLSPIQPDAITLRYPRPDVPLTFDAISISEFDGIIITEDGIFLTTEDGIPLAVEARVGDGFLITESGLFLTTEDGVPLTIETIAPAHLLATEALVAFITENGNSLTTEA